MVKKKALTIAFIAVFILCAAMNIAAINPKQESSAAAPKTMSETVNAEIVIGPITTEDLIISANAKNNVLTNMLNSIDFYDAVSGEFTTTLILFGTEMTVSYMVDIPQQAAYERISGGTVDIENYSVDGISREVNNTLDSVFTAKYNPQLNDNARPDELQSNILMNHSADTYSINGTTQTTRVSEMPDGTPAYYYRQDLTNTDFANTSIFPQGLVMGLLYDTTCWEIESTCSYLGREAIVLNGTVRDVDYSEKLNVDNFTMVVDVDTGIMLDFKGYLDDGTLSQTLTTSEISIVTSADSGFETSIISMLENKGLIDLTETE